MSEPEAKNHWKSLADEIGAEVPDLPEPADEQHNETPSEQKTEESDEPTSNPPPKPEANVAPARPKQSPPPPKVQGASHWSSLAGELGLEVPDEPEPVVEPSDDTDSATTIDGGFEEHLQSPEERQTTSAAQEFDSLFENSPDASPSHAHPAPELAETDEIDLSTHNTSDFGDADAKEDSARQDIEAVDVPAEQASETEESDERNDGRKRRKRRGRRRRRRDADDSTESSEEISTGSEKVEVVAVRSTELEEVEVIVEPESGDEESDDDESSTEGKERRGRRRRRRRGSRRPRDRDESTSEDNKGESAEDDTETEEADLENEISDESDSKEEKRTKHRKIPSWQEALVGMIDSNLKNHASNENSGRKGRGRRGRSSKA